MMRSKAVALATFAGTLAVFLAVMSGFMVWPENAKALSRSLSELKTATVTCATTATEIIPTDPLKNSFTVINTSATAVYIGGSNVDGSTAGLTGLDVCDGCTAGKTLAVDARRGWCVVASGTVALEVVYAR